MSEHITYRTFVVRDEIAPVLERVTTPQGEQLIMRSNGSAGCFGGWLARLPLRGETAVRIRAVGEHVDMDHPEDVLCGTVYWLKADDEGDLVSWSSTGLRSTDHLWPTIEGPGRLTLGGTFAVPEGAEIAQIALFYRWGSKGEVRYLVEMRPADPPQALTSRVSLVTGPAVLRDASVKRDLDFHLRLSEPALADNPDFIGYPEVITRGTVPGVETDRVAKLASDNQVTVALPMFEVERELVFNSVILIGPSGDIIGKYRKVHLAYHEEFLEGVVAGSEFPVFETAIGRLGVNICMDSSVPESSLMVAAHGAEALFMPIMGDLRADRRTPGLPLFSMDRWLVIQRCRALDAQLYMLIARNEGQGSCVIDPWGQVLVLNEGDRGHVSADIEVRKRRAHQGDSDLRAVMRLQRRPHLYSDLTSPHKTV